MQGTEKTWLGHFDDQGNACLKFHFRGARHEHPGVELTGIIDTGFTGFLQLPLDVAIRLALPLAGTATVTLADGSSGGKVMAEGIATFRDQSLVGSVVLEPSSPDILIGMDFLRTFDRSLVITHELVGLISNKNQEGPEATPTSSP